MKIKNVEFIRSATQTKQFIRDDRPQVAFAGRSNVGKSSLLNRLLQRKKLARTSSTPGRTRLINFFLFNDRFYFVDLPGYGYAKASKTERRSWGDMIEEYLTHSSEGVRLVLLVDAKIEGSPLDEQAYAYFQSLGVDQLVVATKIDKVPKTRRTRCLERIALRLALPDVKAIVPVSALTGEGIERLWKELALS